VHYAKTHTSAPNRECKKGKRSRINYGRLLQSGHSVSTAVCGVHSVRLLDVARKPGSAHGTGGKCEGKLRVPSPLLLFAMIKHLISGFFVATHIPLL
jgi:hypothetical protein